MRNDPVMQASFESDFDIKWEGADPKLQFGYAKGFLAGKQKQTPKVDFDPTVAPSLLDQAKQQFKASIEPAIL